MFRVNIFSQTLLIKLPTIDEHWTGLPFKRPENNRHTQPLKSVSPPSIRFCFVSNNGFIM